MALTGTDAARGTLSDSNPLAAAARADSGTGNSAGGLGGDGESIARHIHSIAQQANLLALDAIIEAVGASDAEHGLAAAANQVKQLASETGKATDQITEALNALGRFRE